MMTYLKSFAVTIAVAGVCYADVQDPILPIPPVTADTALNGDANPYGVAFVPAGFPTNGMIQPGDILVSNFNNSKNLAGLGTTIVRITPDGTTTNFYTATDGTAGFTGAFAILKYGYVLAGSISSADGTPGTLKSGGITILDRFGHMVGTIPATSVVNGPWGMAVEENPDTATVFVSNVLDGSIVRFSLNFQSTGAIGLSGITKIASGYSYKTDPGAFVVGPAGLAFDSVNNILYVASSNDGAIYSIHGARNTTSNNGTGTVIYRDVTHLHGPLGLLLTANGHLITANADAVNVDPKQPSELVEFKIDGTFLRQISIDPGNGGAFGLAQQVTGGTIHLAVVNDNAVNLIIWTVPVPK